MPNLLLQKSSKNPKTKDHLTALERRMQSWLKGDLIELLHEGDDTEELKATINERRYWEALMRKGNVNAAINLLTEIMRNGILPLSNETLNLLRLTHPDLKDAHEKA